MAEVEAPLVEDMDPMSFSLSKKQDRVFSFPDQSGEMVTQRKPYTEAYYGGKNVKCTFVLKNVKSFQGVQISKKYKKPIGFMSLSLNSDQSALVRAKVDKVLFNLIFLNKDELIQDGKDIESALEIKRLYKGVVQKGQEMKDKPGYFYNDSMIGGVTLRKVGPNTVPDEHLCPIEDLEGKPYAWTTLGGKELEEVGFEIERIDLGTEFKVRLNIVFITTKEKARAKVTSRRRAEQRKRGAPSAAAASSSDVSMEPADAPIPVAVGSKRKAEEAKEAPKTTKKGRKA